MALSRDSKPNVRMLARRRDVDALVAASTFQDPTPGAAGGLLDRGAAVRREAILALGALGPEFGRDAVTAALSDPSDATRVAAIRVLHAREDAVALGRALALLPADRGHSRPLAIKTLMELCRPECAPSLVDALLRAAGDAPVGHAEIILLRTLLDADPGTEIQREVVDQLLLALTDEQDLVADRAEELLAATEPISTEAVIAELNAGAAPHRAAAVLGHIKDNRALEPLIEGLLHRDPRVRAECAGALGELRDPAAVEALIDASRDPVQRVRSQAGRALDQLGTVALIVGVSSMLWARIQETLAESAGTLPRTPTENGRDALRLVRRLDDVAGIED